MLVISKKRRYNFLKLLLTIGFLFISGMQPLIKVDIVIILITAEVLRYLFLGGIEKNKKT